MFDDSRTTPVLLAVALFAAGITHQPYHRLDFIHLLFAAFLTISFLPLSLLVLTNALRGQLMRPALAGALCAGAAALLFVCMPSIRKGTLSAFAHRVSGTPSSSFLVKRNDRSFRLLSASSAMMVERMLEKLDLLSKPGERLFVGPADLRRTNYSDTFIYHLMPKLRPASPFLEMNPFSANAPGSRLSSDLEQADWLVLNRAWDDWPEQNRSRENGSDEPLRVVRNDFLREYFRKRHSIPELPMVRAFEGGYTDIFFTGVVRNVWHRDIASLYPSVMLQFECFPATDQLQIFRHLLTDVRTFRLEAKAKMRAEQDPVKQHHLQALQNTFKILLNSFYGYLGFAQGHFADFDAAARVTQIGRDLLKKMIDWLNARGAQVVEVDTDGIYFVPALAVESPVSGETPQTSAETADATAIDDLQRGLAKELPAGIDVEIDEQFDAMFSYKAKNYALLTKDGDVIIKGGALKSRGLEKFQRVFLEEMIKLIMQGKPETVGDLRNQFERKIRNREWKIDMLMKTDTLQDSLEKYRAKIAGSARNRAAAYELALASGRNYKPGDQISYYVKATPKKVPAYEAAKPASEFDPENRDENVDYYIAKLDDLMKKFSGLTTAALAPKQESLPL